MDAQDRQAAERLREQALSMPVPVRVEPDGRGVEIALVEPPLRFYHSFLVGPLAQRARQSGQALPRACGNRQRTIRSILDLTAGWGADAFCLASHGRQVRMLEQNSLVAAVLDYSLARLRAAGGAASETAGRMAIECTDSTEYLKSLQTGEFDCIYLDPMFPPRKSGAMPGRELQILQALTGNCDIGLCFELALELARNRVVVKRPARAPGLRADKPDLVYREKSIRFDIYLTA